MNDCDFDALSRYVDGDLSIGERQRVNRHLLECRACAAELRDLRRMNNVLKTWGARRMPLPAASDRRITNTVRRRRRARRLGPFLAASRMMPAAVGSSIAAVLVLLSANVHGPYATPASRAAEGAATRSSIQRHVAPLLKARQSSAILGGQTRPQPGTSQSHRLPFDVN